MQHYVICTQEHLEQRSRTLRPTSPFPSLHPQKSVRMQKGTHSTAQHPSSSLFPSSSFPSNLFLILHVIFFSCGVFSLLNLSSLPLLSSFLERFFSDIYLTSVRAPCHHSCRRERSSQCTQSLTQSLDHTSTGTEGEDIKTHRRLRPGDNIHQLCHPQAPAAPALPVPHQMQVLERFQRTILDALRGTCRRRDKRA